MPSLFRTLLVCTLCLLLVAMPTAAGGAAPRAEKPSEYGLKRRANKAAAAYARAQRDVGRLDSDIARLERETADLQARIAPLREAVTRRAVALYQASRGVEALAGLSEQDNLVASARRARLVSEVSSGDVASLEELEAAGAELRARRESIAGKRSEREAAMVELDNERRVVELELAAMARARRDLQSRLLPSRASRSGSRGQEPAQTLAQAAAIPVITDFICPIRGPVAFTDSWGDPRSGGRRHKGTDLMSPHGTENVAVVSGQIERHHSGAGGLSIYLHGDDGNTYYYAHLSEVVGPDRRVAQGEVVGLTGSSGNARGGSPHTHFEIHPGGGQAVNPYPTVRRVC